MGEGIEAATCMIRFHAWFLYLHLLYPSICETIVVLYISCPYVNYLLCMSVFKKKIKMYVSVFLHDVNSLEQFIINLYLSISLILKE
jgi:hypothetical protein